MGKIVLETMILSIAAAVIFNIYACNGCNGGVCTCVKTATVKLKQRDRASRAVTLFINNPISGVQLHY